ncbi:(Fe-S)-binding protein [Gloeobacter morelensis]|uniref:Glycolate oxidase iron-sulfur subunit n=1 Tax=Gloeobacter morelensis MG652769 TaxID=2781736 RepID=A0ABY3PNG3_9CYAN|nr:heterodisulfide reductase-related iron-sulfur binding cluster [Gloeobacter morelensis]UFP95231.1 4Fe-4S dicluster domain-containing protein [Gloeobacter morelensis MG652769]
MENQPRPTGPRAFDADHPPAPQIIDTCVHCGFCLATCPSYRVLGTEMDSPRGRIYLMDALNEGQIPLSQTTAGHFDSCLGCLACVSTCPSGVQYDQLIAATRPQVERNVDRSVPERLLRALIFNLLPYPRRLRPLLVPLVPYQKLGLQKLVRKSGLLPKIAPRLAAMESILPEVPASAFAAPMPERVAAQGKQRFRVGLITGCVQQLFFDRVNRATLRVLTAIGCEVVIPRSQGCCAALPQHQGQSEQARQMARDLIDSFADSGVDYLIINAAGCGHTLKEYGHILADDPLYRERAAAFAAKVRDVQEFLYWAKIPVPLQPIADGPLALVYQDACHLLHGQRISLQPRQLLAQIPGVQVREPVDAALCCGSAGVYNILQPEIGEELGRQKVENLLATGAVLIASANPGCALQIRKHLELTGQAVPVRHPMELIDAAIRGVKVADLRAS